MNVELNDKQVESLRMIAEALTHANFKDDGSVILDMLPPKEEPLPLCGCGAIPCQANSGRSQHWVYCPSCSTRTADCDTSAEATHKWRTAMSGQDPHALAVAEANTGLRIRIIAEIDRCKIMHGNEGYYRQFGLGLRNILNSSPLPDTEGGS